MQPNKKIVSKKLKNALIGYSGFIGSNLINLRKNFDLYNSKNIKRIKLKSYNSIYCAGTYSKIWLAKKNPNKDKKNLDNLISNLTKVKAKNFFLISTCEVFGKQKKTFENLKIKENYKYAYGYNRLNLEKFIEKKFLNHFILRLPIVYGKNFSKNFLYDLINSKNLEQINGNDTVQIYNVANLKKHLKYVEKNKIKKINLSSKPLKIKYIAKKFFNIKLRCNKKFRVINMKSIYGKNKGHYFLSGNKTLKDLKNFLR